MLAPLESHLLARAHRGRGRDRGVEVVEARRVFREQGNEDRTRGGTRRRFAGSARRPIALHEIGFVRACDAIDRVVDRCVQDIASAREACGGDVLFARIASRAARFQSVTTSAWATDAARNAIVTMSSAVIDRDFIALSPRFDVVDPRLVLESLELATNTRRSADVDAVRAGRRRCAHLRQIGVLPQPLTQRIDRSSLPPGYQPHFGHTSTLVPLVFVIWDAVLEPSALIKKISLLTKPEHCERRGVKDV
jgi:hypothetical protein